MFLPDIRFCTSEHVSMLLEVDASSPHPWPGQVIATDLETEAGFSYLGAFAPVNDKLLGYAVWGIEKGRALLMNIVVLPAFQRRSIGTQLLLAVAECAMDRNFFMLDLRVRASNHAALSLYRGMGFRENTTRGGYYSDGDTAFCMSAALPLELKDVLTELP